jgi:hypothetical protein
MFANKVDNSSTASSQIALACASPAAAKSKTLPACFTLSSPRAATPFLVIAVPEHSPSAAPAFNAPCLYPPGFTIMFPISPACPRPPETNLPSTMKAPPIPVDTVIK